MSDIKKQALRTDLLIANALETAKQLRELQESPVAEAIFESIVENENGKEIQFERPISDLAYAAFLKIERLTEALEAALRANAAQDDHINQQQDRIDTLERKNAELGRALGAAERRNAELTTERGLLRSRFKLEREILEDADSDLDMLRQRIASLEARMLTVRQPDVLGRPPLYAQNKTLEAVAVACAAAGIKLQIEGE